MATQIQLDQIQNTIRTRGRAFLTSGQSKLLREGLTGGTPAPAPSPKPTSVSGISGPGIFTPPEIGRRADEIRAGGLGGDINAPKVQAQLSKEFPDFFKSIGRFTSEQKETFTRQEAEINAAFAKAGIERPSRTIGTTNQVRRDIADAGKQPSDLKDIKTEEDFETFKKEELDIKGPIPERPDFVSNEEATKLLVEREGATKLQEEAIGLEADLEEALAGLEAFRAEELSGPGTLGFARGTIGEEERKVMERVGFIERRLNTINRRLQLKNANIKTIMDLNDQEFDDAVDAYNDGIDRSLRIYDRFLKDQDRQLAHDEAAYDTMYNQFVNSGKKIEDLDPAFINRMRALEAKLGQPVGTFESLAVNEPNAEIIQKGSGINPLTGEKIAYQITQAGNEVPKVNFTPTGLVTPSERTRIAEGILTDSEISDLVSSAFDELGDAKLVEEEINSDASLSEAEKETARRFLAAHSPLDVTTTDDTGGIGQTISGFFNRLFGGQ